VSLPRRTREEGERKMDDGWREGEEGEGRGGERGRERERGWKSTCALSSSPPLGPRKSWSPPWHLRTLDTSTRMYPPPHVTRMYPPPPSLCDRRSTPEELAFRCMCCVIKKEGGHIKKGGRSQKEGGGGGLISSACAV